ncbi:MAG: 2-succinyl-5-enolpyruvyl-6-hydroxy-3-cyclohexene-1-carboxylic-acid synthase, partial [Candidatus Thermoplasmatota archaeon]|nr:2-succinyl-5-enolpyruvyl-6-hydroxy-3-cyclohexene-1-carboxylic-acid synthase [Candidatus Thermoplasmatota archaeon]
VRLYGEHVRAFHELPEPEVTDVKLRHLRQVACRAMADARAPHAGPVHLNLPFEKPLEPTPVTGDVPEEFQAEHPLAATGRPDGSPFTTIHPSSVEASEAALQHLVEAIQASPRGLIVCGPSTAPSRTGPAALALARATGYPLIADPLSGARFAPGAPEHALAHADLFLRAPDLLEELAPDLVLRIGATPTSKHLAAYLAEHQHAHQVVIDPGTRYMDHLASASTYLRGDPEHTCQHLARRLQPVADAAWQRAWQAAEQATAPVLSEALDRHPYEATVLRDVTQALPDGASLFVSNSMPIRDLDAACPPQDRAINVHANRGASGIDGITSTAAGIAAATGPTVAVVGDLAFLHDANGLQAVADEQLPLVLVVLNNDGGAIFQHLPIRDHEPPFTQRFTTPHGRDLSHLAALHAIPFTRTKGPGATAAALQQALYEEGPHILEVPSDREDNHRRHEDVAQAVVDEIQRHTEETP